MASARRTIDRSTAQKHQPDEDFSQALPDDFDEAAFDQDIARTFEEVETGAGLLAQARLPVGLADRNLDAEIVAAGFDHEGVAERLKDAQSQAARAATGELLAVSLRRVPARGGVAVSLRLAGEEHLRSGTMSAEDAEALEGAHRAALHAFAEVAAPILARAGRAKVMLDRAVPGAANDGAAALAAKLARRA